VHRKIMDGQNQDFTPEFQVQNGLFIINGSILCATQAIYRRIVHGKIPILHAITGKPFLTVVTKGGKSRGVAGILTDSVY
jgi:hypothetical protein